MSESIRTRVVTGTIIWIFAFALAGFIAYVVKPWIVGLMK